MADPRDDPDGKYSLDEHDALFNRDPNFPRPHLDLFAIDPFADDEPNRQIGVRVIWVKESGIPYDAADPDGFMVRGLARGTIFARNLPNQLLLAAAHEVGHQLQQGIFPSPDYRDGDGHEAPPFPIEVVEDDPLAIAPEPPEDNDATGQHHPEPGRVIMMDGSPTAEGLPWLHGRWMSHGHWREMNKQADVYQSNIQN